MLGALGLEILRAGAGRNRSLALITDNQARRRCRCFLRSLAHDKKADPVLLLRKSTIGLDWPREQIRIVRIRPGEPLLTAGGGHPGTPAQLRALVAAQRGALLWMCGASSEHLEPELDERRACDVELGANRQKFLCSLAAAQLGQTRYASNCSRGRARW